MSEKININKILCEDEGVLKTKDEVVTAKILDIELDPLELTFNNDECVQINTQGYSYITLSYSNLDQLQRLIDEAQEYFDEYFANQEEEE